jgi:hypothetical protein
MLPPPRDDAQGLRGRLEAIDAELDDVRNQALRLSTLERERARLEAERAEVASRLGAYGRRLELEDLRVASPCKADWGKMMGDDAVRFCSSCQKNVYNLSGMTRDEAMGLIRQNEGGEICVRMYRRADDTVITGDCPEGARRKRRRLALLGAGGGVAMAAAASAFGSASQTCTIEQGATTAVGSVPLPPPTPPTTGDTPEGPSPPSETADQKAIRPPLLGAAVVGRLPIRRLEPTTPKKVVPKKAPPTR